MRVCVCECVRAGVRVCACVCVCCCADSWLVPGLCVTPPAVRVRVLAQRSFATLIRPGDSDTQDEIVQSFKLLCKQQARTNYARTQRSEQWGSKKEHARRSKLSEDE